MVSQRENALRTRLLLFGRGRSHPSIFPRQCCGVPSDGERGSAPPFADFGLGASAWADLADRLPEQAGQRLRFVRKAGPDPQRLEGAQGPSDLACCHPARDQTAAADRQLGFRRVGEKPIGSGEGRIRRGASDFARPGDGRGAASRPGPNRSVCIVNGGRGDPVQADSAEAADFNRSASALARRRRSRSRSASSGSRRRAQPDGGGRRRRGRARPRSRCRRPRRLV